MNGRSPSCTTAPPGTYTHSQEGRRRRQEEGAEVRRRHVEELASELHISQNQYLGRHRSIVSEDPVATLDDSIGPIASRSEHRPVSATSPHSWSVIDQARLWQKDKLADKAATTSFTSSARRLAGQELEHPHAQQHLYHSGIMMAVRARLHGPASLRGGRQRLRHILHLRPPGHPAGRECARCRALPGPAARPLRSVIAEARSRGAFAVRRPSPEAFLGATLT